MAKRGGWKTIMKYAAGILALSASIAVAWFLPGLYAGWQDARTEGHVTLSRRENIQFIDTASLDIAGRLQMLEETKDFAWSWGEKPGMNMPMEELFSRCHDMMEEWCEAGLFPEDCLAGIVSENLYLSDIGTVYLDNATLPVYCLRFYDMGGYAVTLVTDEDVGMIYYASVIGPPMLDVVSEDLGYESFAAMSEYELRQLVEQGITPQQLMEGDADMTTDDFCSHMAETARPAEESQYDFAAVCGAQGAKVVRGADRLRLDVELSFENFTGHAYRLLATSDYNANPEKSGAGFAVMYGTQRWKNLTSDFSALFGSWENVADEDLEWDWYLLGLDYASGNPGAIYALDYPPVESAETKEAQKQAQGAVYDAAPTTDLADDSGQAGAEAEQEAGGAAVSMSFDG